MPSYIDHLECTQCGKTYDHKELAKVSQCCGVVLFARYDLPRLRSEVSRDAIIGRPANMWQFEELLPVENPGNIVTLGEGGTPLLRASPWAVTWAWTTCTSKRKA